MQVCWCARRLLAYPWVFHAFSAALCEAPALPSSGWPYGEYKDFDSPEDVAGRTAGSPTKLTAWFDLNNKSEDPDVADIKCCDIPTHYRWEASTKVRYVDRPEEMLA